jgi:acid phosphatase (class A)
LGAPLGALYAQDPHYLRAGRPDPNILASPPLPASPEQAADMAELVAVHSACTSNQMEAALSEKKFSLFTFRPALGDILQPGNLPKTEAFFERLLHDASMATDTAKDFWKRPRPYTIDPTLVAGKMEKTFSYPSGHSTEATVTALVLAELFPGQKQEILAIGRDIGWHRVQLARHYPTDIYAGRVFAQAIVREMKADRKFRRDFAAAQAEIAREVPSPGAKPVKEKPAPVVTGS